MSGLNTLAPVTIAAAFAFGMVLALLGSIKLPLAKRLALSEAQVGTLLAALWLALIPMMPISGLLIDRLGPRGVLIVGALLVAMALSWLALGQTYRAALGSILLVGAGGACLSTGSSVLMEHAFFPGNAAASQNLGNVFFGLGALLTPALAEWLMRTLDYRRAVGLLAAVCIVPALLAAGTASATWEVLPRGGGEGGWRQVLGDPVLWMIGLAFLLYAPLESTIATWATTYLTDLGVNERRAAWLLSGFWATYLLGRLVAALAQQELAWLRGSESWLVVVLALLAAVFVGNLVGARTGSLGSAGLLALGAFLGPIFPTLVGILFEHFTHHKGTAFGAMFAIGSVGVLFLPPLIGAYARRTSIRRAMGIPLVLALLLAGLLLFTGLLVPLVEGR